MWAAGERVRASRLSYESDSISMGFTTPSSAGDWVDYGSTITFPDPGRGVTVSADLTCNADRGSSTRADCDVRVAISLDGGATFETGNHPRATVGNFGESRTTRADMWAIHTRTGIPTAGVVVKAQVRNIDESDDTTFRHGHLTARMIPVT